MASAHWPLTWLGLILTLSCSCLAFQATQATITPRGVRPSPDPQANLRSDSSLVVIPTHVTTVYGSSVTSLSRENFRLIEDNVEQPIVHFDKDDAPVSIGLLFDKSGSMKDKMEKGRRSRKRVLQDSQFRRRILPRGIQRPGETRGSLHPRFRHTLQLDLSDETVRNDFSSRRDPSFASANEEGAEPSQGDRDYLRRRR